MDSVCVISFTGINDSRALRTIKLMATLDNIEIDFFFVRDNSNYSKFKYPGKINLFPVNDPKSTFTRKIKNHSFLFLNSRFFVDAILATEKAYKIIYCHDLTTSFAGYILKKKLHSKLIYDVHDLYIETINQFFPRNTSGIKKVIFIFFIWEMRLINKFWEKKFFHNVDLTLTTNENYSKYLKKAYSINQITITPNYPEYFEHNHKKEIYRNLEISDNFKIVLYHGALTEGRYLREIVESANFFSNEIKLIIIGDGPMKKELIELSNSQNNIIFIDFIPYKDLFNFISGATLGLILIEHINLSKKYALANKVTEYMSVGIPVFASNSSENIKLIATSDSGYIHEFDNTKKLATAIMNAVQDPNLKIKGENGRNAFKTNFNWNMYENDFIEAFNKLLH
jgi:glycosyltransferase involved in cell wall biosynthesis